MADTHYHSLNSLTVCKKVDAYITDIQFRQRDPRFADQERFKDKKKANTKSSPFSTAYFPYDESKRVYLYPSGCTMGIIRSGTQYRQDPRFRRADISLFGACPPVPPLYAVKVRAVDWGWTSIYRFFNSLVGRR